MIQKILVNDYNIENSIDQITSEFDGNLSGLNQFMMPSPINQFLIQQDNGKARTPL